MYCVIDIESSGGPFGKEAIIEIAAFRYDGDQVVDQLISLVHPHRPIQKFVTKITGINEKMLIRAPRFHEIAKRLLEITQNAIIVGHNVEFDYRMLRQEYGRLGYEFERGVLDTIQLAEKLIPGLKSYGLDNVCEELGIYRSEKHRAADDARATLALFQILQEKDRAKEISIMGQSIVRNDHLQDKLNDLTRGLKANRGIFYLHDKEGNLLYLSTSDNIKDELNRLFMAENKLGDAIREKVHSVKTEAAGNWLIARIKEYEELQKVKPALNEARQLSLEYGIYGDFRKAEPQLTVKPVEEMGKKKPLAKAESSGFAFRAIRMYKRQDAVGDSGTLLQSVKSLPQEALYRGRGRSRSEKSAFLVSDGLLVGYFYYKLNDELSDMERLKKNMVKISKPRLFTPLLKLGILSREFEYIP